MNVIYEPKGRAREYAPLACNLYMGCTRNRKNGIRRRGHVARTSLRCLRGIAFGL